MTEMQKIYLLIPLLPLFAAAVVGLFGSKLPRAAAHLITIPAVAAAFGLSAGVAAVRGRVSFAKPSPARRRPSSG